MYFGSSFHIQMAAARSLEFGQENLGFDRLFDRSQSHSFHSGQSTQTGFASGSRRQRSCAIVCIKRILHGKEHAEKGLDRREATITSCLKCR